MRLKQAHDLMRDVSYYGTMMVFESHAAGMVSGAAHTTLHTIRPDLQFVETKPGFSVVSSVFFMCLDGEVPVKGNCTVQAKQQTTGPDAQLLDRRVPFVPFGEGCNHVGTALRSWSIKNDNQGDYRQHRKHHSTPA